MKIQKESGFNLVELMLTIALLGILAAFAYPVYEEYMQRARRIDCENTLMSAAAVLERKHSVINKYASDGLSLPTQCPRESNKKFYSVEYNLAKDGSTFTLVATPMGAQASDTCGALTLNHVGEKGASGGSISACW
ncbi:MAG: type IV pilin protein [Zoogloeaceae bacterium]|jgi:type IV pilus assembly protein PilE|nr:type IV pilin protein [Zoogloeaceae bacterium]